MVLNVQKIRLWLKFDIYYRHEVLKSRSNLASYEQRALNALKTPAQHWLIDWLIEFFFQASGFEVWLIDCFFFRQPGLKLDWLIDWIFFRQAGVKLDWLIDYFSQARGVEVWLIDWLIDFFRQAGLKLVLTVNPFISTESSNFKTAVNEEYFVLERNATKSVPALTWFKVRA